MYNHLKFKDIVRICELKASYCDLIEKVTVPKSRKQPTLENAEWFISNGHIFNQSNKFYNTLLKVCVETLELKGYTKWQQEPDAMDMEKDVVK